MDYNTPGSSVHDIFRARILELVAISFSRGSFQPRDRTQVCCIAGRLFTVWASREDGFGGISKQCFCIIFIPYISKYSSEERICHNSRIWTYNLFFFKKNGVKFNYILLLIFILTHWYNNHYHWWQTWLPSHKRGVCVSLFCFNYYHIFYSFNILNPSVIFLFRLKQCQI